MDYNTDLPKLVISEYGRNIQKMIDYAITIKDREERNKVANSIIAIMGYLNPHLNNVADFKHKLWDHIFIISDFKLDVDSPYPMPTAATFQTKPERIKYPSNDIAYKHYGKNLENIIEKAKAYPEGAEKDALTEIIANLMKRSYLTWNRDSVEDSTILKQLTELSKGQLRLTNPGALRSSQALVTKALGNSSKDKKKNKPGGTYRPNNPGNNNPNNKFKKRF